MAQLLGAGHPKDEGIKRHYVEHYYRQLRGLVAFLEKTTGKSLDKNRLSEALDNRIQSATLFHETPKLHKARPNPLPAQDSATIGFPHLHFAAWPEAGEFYKKAYDEVKYRADNKISSIPEEKYRLYWYLMIPWYYIGIYNWLEETFGVTTICDTYEAAEPPPAGVVDLDYPLESIARAMYKGGCAQGMGRRGLGPLRIKDVRNKDDMAAFAREYHLDGAISLLVNSCRSAQMVIHSWRQVKEWIGLRTLTLEADMVDDRTFSDALLKDRITAFMETVDAAKRGRRS